MASPNPILLRPEDFPGLVKASGGELDKLFRALNGNYAEMARALAGLLAAVPPPKFAAPSMLNGWINFGDLPSRPAQYGKDALGWVHSAGVVRDGTIGLPIFVLPVGFRPAGTRGFAAPSNGTTGTLVVFSTGEVIAQAPANNGFVYLDPISFLAEN
jgi:hypothetical protein